jgi:hypothetical protein
MQIVENWTRLSGIVDAWQPPTRDDGEGYLVVRIERTADVPRSGGGTFPNLLEASAGEAVRVRIPPSVARALDTRVGSRVELDVRRGRSAAYVFAHPDVFKSQPLTKRDARGQ